MTGTVSRLIARAATRPAPHRNVSTAVVELLHALGVRSVFGIVGGAIAPFADVLGRDALTGTSTGTSPVAAPSAAPSSAPLRFYAMRHEGGAAFAATEASLAGRRPTCVMTTTGPGLTNALTGIVAARSEGAHVLVISACTTPRQRGRYAVQEMSDKALVPPCAMPAAFDFSATIEHAHELATAAEVIARGMERPHGFVAHLALSLAVQRAPFEGSFEGSLLPRLKIARDTIVDERALADVERALAEPFAIWAGFGARHASAQLRAFAEKMGAPVMLSPRGKGVFPEDHPLFLGVTGIGGHDVDARLRPLEVQRTLVIGSRLGEFTSTWNPALAPPGGFVHVDVDARVFGAAYPDVPTLGVVADARAFLEQMSARLPVLPKARRLHAPASRWNTFAAPTSSPVRPQVLMQVVQRLVVDEHGPHVPERERALVFAEPGNSFAWANHLLRFAAPDYRLSGYWASMGHMVTGAVGAALETGRPCVVITGDGSMLMQSELSTAVQYHAPVVWIVLNDGRYGMTEDGMSAQGFAPMHTRFPRVDFVAMARAVGADGLAVKDEAVLLDAISIAMDARAPFVVDVQIDVNERAPFLARVKQLAAMGAP